MEWVKIKDGLPEEEQTVLAYNGEDMLIGIVYAQNIGSGYDCVSNKDEIYDITHWMPLPETPQSYLNKLKKVLRIEKT